MAEVGIDRPLLSIITPTILRQTLVGACRSIDIQSFRNWEQIVMIDTDQDEPSMIESLKDPRRQFHHCPHPHHNSGNTCRHNAHSFATGDFIFYLDDDNFLEENILDELKVVLPEVEHWALFPIQRLGSRFYTDPPRSCHIDTMNVIVRREIGRWPDTDAYGADGDFIEDLVRKYPYKSFPEFRPIANLPIISFGK